jgi:hypothetical protein
MDLAVWRDISLIWLLFLTLLAVVPFGVLFFFAIRGMRRLRQLAKQYLPLAQEKARLVSDKTEEISHKVASPLIGVHARAAQASGVTKAILTRRKKA